jgi:methyl coenzyme M reductase alpha subunit
MKLFELQRLITEIVLPLCVVHVSCWCAMGQVLQFSRRNRGFDAEATAALIAAYESAVAAIARSGQPNNLCEVAARRIIAMASKGERNPDRLCAAALATVTKSARQRSDPPVRLSPHLILIDASDKIAWLQRPDLASD